MEHEYIKNIEGSQLLRGMFPELNMSEIGKTSANFLGIVFSGIYHVPDRSLRKASWDRKFFCEITIPMRLATWDSNYMTRAVVVAHDMALRLEIFPSCHGYMKWIITKRKRGHLICEECPTMEEHIYLIRNGRFPKTERK